MLLMLQVGSGVMMAIEENVLFSLVIITYHN